MTIAQNAFNEAQGLQTIFRTKYSGMDQVKFVEEIAFKNLK